MCASLAGVSTEGSFSVSVRGLTYADLPRVIAIERRRGLAAFAEFRYAEKSPARSAAVGTYAVSPFWVLRILVPW